MFGGWLPSIFGRRRESEREDEDSSDSPRPAVPLIKRSKSKSRESNKSGSSVEANEALLVEKWTVACLNSVMLPTHQELSNVFAPLPMLALFCIIWMGVTDEVRKHMKAVCGIDKKGITDFSALLTRIIAELNKDSLLIYRVLTTPDQIPTIDPIFTTKLHKRFGRRALIPADRDKQRDYINEGNKHPIAMPRTARRDKIQACLIDERAMILSDSLLYDEFLNYKNFVVKTVGDIISDNCCDDHCNLIIAPLDVYRVRAGLVRALKGSPVREHLLVCLVSFINSRVDVASYDPVSKTVAVDTSLFGKKICRQLFLDIIALPFTEYRAIVIYITLGISMGRTRNLGSTGLLGDSTCRSIARIAVDSDLHGQYNPIDGSLMLHPENKKKWYLRRNSRGSYLPDWMVREYIGLSIKKRAVDSFMRCDVCITLNSEYRNAAVLLRLATTNKWKKNFKTANYTALAYQQQVVARRKQVLFDLFRTYQNKRNKMAEIEKVPIDQIPIDRVVPDADVKTSKFVVILNRRVRKDQPTFTITESDVITSELTQMDEGACQLFLTGELAEDLSEPPQNGEEMDDRDSSSGDSDSDPAENDEDGDNSTQEKDVYFEDMDLVSKSIAEKARKLLAKDRSVSARRRLGLLSAVEQLVARRKFHNEHVTAERVIAYSALETAAKNPLSVMCFIADGVSKDKTRLPNKEKGKNDETIERLDCYVTGMQMSVAREAEAPTKTEVQTDLRQRKCLREQRKKIQSDPKAFSDEAKKAHDDEMRAFADKDVAAASGFGFVNHDFIYPYGFGGTPTTDALISNLLHILASDQVSFTPSCIVLILDNASSNKSIFTIRAFALLLELIPPLREVHLYFPTVGHTHNSLDAHFGALCTRLSTTTVGTPADLAACFESVKDTRAHIDFNYYKFSKEVDFHVDAVPGVSPRVDGCGYEFNYLSNQHYFMIFRDSNGDVRFSNKGFLRFAEPLSSRVIHVLSKCRELIPLSDEERKDGCPVFITGTHGRKMRSDFAKTVLPLSRDVDWFKGHSDALRSQLIAAGMDTAQRDIDLDSLAPSKNPDCNLSLYDMCMKISMKMPLIASDANVETGTAQEMAIAMQLRMRGRHYKSSEMTSAVRKMEEQATRFIAPKLMEVCLDGDDGTMSRVILERLRKHCDEYTDSTLECVLKQFEATHVSSNGVSSAQPTMTHPMQALSAVQPTTPIRSANSRFPKTANMNDSDDDDDDMNDCSPPGGDGESGGDDEEEPALPAKRVPRPREPYSPGNYHGVVKRRK